MKVNSCTYERPQYRIANLPFSKPDFEILAFLTHFFENQLENKKSETKPGFSSIFFNRKGLTLTKRCLSLYSSQIFSDGSL